MPPRPSPHGPAHSALCARDNRADIPPPVNTRPAKESVVVQAVDYHEEGVDPRWADTEQAPRYVPSGKKQTNKEQKDVCRPFPTPQMAATCPRDVRGQHGDEKAGGLERRVV